MVRGGIVESRHHGRVVALDAAGAVVLAVGDVNAPLLPRSSLKPLQATGMVDAGLDVPLDCLALACASHSGQPRHVSVVRRLLSSAGLDEAALDNTSDMPIDAGVRRSMTRAGMGKDRLHQNCSGKHAAMLATCVAAGWPTEGYRSPEHPVQTAIADAVSRLAGEPIAGVTVDGCGAPVFALSLLGLARAFAAVATSPETTAAGRCADAMRADPWLVGGTGRDVTELMTALPGLIAKEGAEGVYAVALPDGRAVAVKVDDGASRARLPAVVASLRRLGVDDPALARWETSAVLGHGEPAGEVRAVL